MNSGPLILLVDDSEEDLLLAQRVFKQAGLLNPVQAVRSGEEAIRRLSNKEPYGDRERFPTPALILLDVRMPGVSGYDVLQWIRSELQLRDVRVVVLTGLESVYDIDKAYKLGANSFLIKPLDSEKVTNLWKSFGGSWLWHPQVPVGGS